MLLLHILPDSPSLFASYDAWENAHADGLSIWAINNKDKITEETSDADIWNMYLQSEEASSVGNMFDIMQGADYNDEEAYDAQFKEFAQSQIDNPLLNKNGDGFLNFGEFTSDLTSEIVFYKNQIEKGNISKEDALDVLSEVMLEAQALFDTIDTNGNNDGLIDADELAKYYKYLDKNDGSKNGEISIQSTQEIPEYIYNEVKGSIYDESKQSIRNYVNGLLTDEADKANENLGLVKKEYDEAQNTLKAAEQTLKDAQANKENGVTYLDLRTGYTYAEGLKSYADAQEALAKDIAFKAGINTEGIEDWNSAEFRNSEIGQAIEETCRQILSEHPEITLSEGESAFDKIFQIANDGHTSNDTITYTDPKAINSYNEAKANAEAKEAEFKKAVEAEKQAEALKKQNIETVQNTNDGTEIPAEPASETKTEEHETTTLSNGADLSKMTEMIQSGNYVGSNLFNLSADDMIALYDACDDAGKARLYNHSRTNDGKLTSAQKEALQKYISSFPQSSAKENAQAGTEADIIQQAIDNGWNINTTLESLLDDSNLQGISDEDIAFMSKLAHAMQTLNIKSLSEFKS